MNIERLGLLVKKYGISVAKMAVAIDVPYMRLKRILSGGYGVRELEPGELKRLEKYVGAICRDLIKENPVNS